MALAPPIVPADASTNMGYKLGLSDLLPDMISPDETPFIKNAKRVQARSIDERWQTDSLASVTGSTYRKAFNTDSTFATTMSRAEVNNYIERVVAPWGITEAAELVAKANGIAGVGKSEVAYEVEKVWKNLLNSCEKHALSANTKVADNDSTPAEMDCAFTLVTTNITTLSAADTTVSEDDFNSKVRDIRAGGGPAIMDAYMTITLMDSWNTTFTGNRNLSVYDAAGAKQISTFVNKYLTRCGVLVNYMPDLQMVTDTGILIVDPNFVKIHELGGGPFVTSVTPASGSNHYKGQVSWYWTLDMGNEKRHGGWKGQSCPTA